MRRIVSTFALALSVAFAPACGDDKPATTTDTSSGNDTSVAEDTATGEDTTTNNNTTPDADAAMPMDTATGTDTSMPIDDGTGLCTGIIACVADCQTEACAQTCGAAADSSFELNAFTGFLTCLDEEDCIPATNPPTLPEEKAAYECQRTKCLDEIVACQQGETAGAGACPAIGGCLNRCEPGDAVCARACFAGATAVAAGQFLNLNLCINAECAGSRGTPADFQACATQAQQQQPCSLFVSQCFGNVGGAPEAGAGGGFGANAFSFHGH